MKAINILVAIFLLSLFFIAGQNVVQTFTVANTAALNNLKPEPMDYFWELNIHHAALDRNKIRTYADYYEHLLQVYPFLWDAYGVVGYCYHYLNDDPKAIKFLKIAIQHDPEYFWNYYNLAIIYFNESRYQDTASLLQEAFKISPKVSFYRMFKSEYVYVPLLSGPNEKIVFEDAATHLREVYQSSVVLMQILNQSKNSQEQQEALGRLNPVLYAF